MKNKLMFMIFTIFLLLNFSCTNDDYNNQEIEGAEQKNIKIVPRNLMNATNLNAIDSSNIGFSPQMVESDGDPENPKIK